MTDAQEIDLPLQLLQILDKDGDFYSLKLAADLGVPHLTLIGAIKSLLAHEGVSDYI
jgi:hypothetical protein